MVAVGRGRGSLKCISIEPIVLLLVYHSGLRPPQLIIERKINRRRFAYLSLEPGCSSAHCNGARKVGSYGFAMIINVLSQQHHNEAQ